MSTRRGGENIWIAYADMLTVLLMVFLLLAMLFQVIVATSKIAGPDDVEAGNQSSQSGQQENARQQNVAGGDERVGTSSQRLSDKAQAGSKRETRDVAVNLPLDMVHTDVLKPREGDLRINIELSRTYLTTVQQEEVRAWALKNKNILSTAKLRIYSVGRSDNVSSGDTLQMQVNRAVATMAVLQKEGAVIKNIRFDNLVVPDNKDDFIILRVEETDADNTNKTE